MIGTSGLTLREGVLLGHALVAQAAARAGARVLLVKGPAFERLGLRLPRQSVDIDALVHPADVGGLRGELEALGWRVRVPDTTAHALPFHSVPLTCEGWPCEIDLHHHFPGFFAAPEVVFETLWRRHSSLAVAEEQVPVCDLPGSVLVSALHSERAPHLKRDESRYLVAQVRRQLDVEGIHELALLAAETGCADTLRSFLNAVGAPPIGVGSTPRELLHDWAVETGAQGAHGVFWLHELKRTPPRRLLPTLWHALMFTESELRSLFPQAAPGPLGLWQARWWRLRRALRHLPKAVWLLGTADRRR